MDAMGKKHGEETTFSRGPKNGPTIQRKDENNKLPPELWAPYFFMSENRLVSVGVKFFNPTDWEDCFFWGLFFVEGAEEENHSTCDCKIKVVFFQIARWVDGLGWGRFFS